MKKLGIYVHIPFCTQKCSYCDFYSQKWDKESEKKFIDAVLDEIKSYYYELNEQYIVDTIFFGGGTPSILNPDNIKKIIDALGDIFVIDSDSEITIEANPNSLTQEKLKAYKSIGINRLSIGIQSLDDDNLKILGRIHNHKQALLSIERAREEGFENINADVMFNIPDQTFEQIERTLQLLIENKIEHISYYSLLLEEGTPLYNLEKNKKIVMPEELEERRMYYFGRELMKNNNLSQYEISNFALENYKCKHNLKYWNQEEYIGLGPSAHSFLNYKRYSNVADTYKYSLNSKSNLFNRKIEEILGYDDLKFEYIMLRLRLNEGLNIVEFNKKFNSDFTKEYGGVISELKYNNLVVLNSNHICLTEKGMDVSNFVFEKFM